MSSRRKFFRSLSIKPGSRRERAERELRRYYVRCSDVGIEVRKPTQEETLIKWEQLKTILVQAHEPVPGLPSMMWILSGEGAVCIIPQGARGEEIFVKWIEQLPDFQSEKLATARACEEEQTFTVWERPQINDDDEAHT
jgi:hypothetical protein